MTKNGRSLMGSPVSGTDKTALELTERDDVFTHSCGVDSSSKSPASTGSPLGGKPAFVQNVDVAEPQGAQNSARTEVPQRRRSDPGYRLVGGSPRVVLLRSAAQRRRAQDWIDTYQRNLLITDVVIVGAMVFASQATRLPDTATVSVRGVGGFSYWLLSCALVLLWMAALGLSNAWDKNILGAGPSEYHRITQATFYLFGFIGTLSFITRTEVARGYLAMALPLGLLGMLAGRWVWRQLLNEHRKSGTHTNTVLVLGSRASAASLASRLRSSPSSGYRVVGLCTPLGSTSDDSSVDGFELLGTLDNVVDAIEQSKTNTVAVSSSEHFGSDQVRQLAWQLEGTGVRLVLAPSLTDVAGPRIHIRPVAGLPLMLVQEPHFRGPKLALKTTLDVIVALVVLTLLSPVLLVTAAAIKMSDRGPVFFRHERVGYGGRQFKVWKFRSMRIGAESRINEVKTAAGQGDATFYKSAGDPRISPLGAFLRKTSIDELPQLFNVLAGQMSLVGPRPLVPGEGAEIGNFVERRMLVRPGITGLWQVSGRSDVTAEERIRLDFYYVENWSVIGDVLIMAKTVKTVLTGAGAY